MALPSPEYLVGFEFYYACQLDQLAPPLRERWVELVLDAATRQFIEEQFARPHGLWMSGAASLLRSFLSDFDVNALLRMYPLHLLSEAQWRQILPEQDGAGRHLDVGAGNGDLTSCLEPLFSTTLTTESSRGMVRALRRRGFNCQFMSGSDPQRDLSRTLDNATFDVVTCLNVVDRTSRPTTLIRALGQRVSPGGSLVVAVPLPLQPFYYRRAKTLAPNEPLEVAAGAWEQQCSILAQRLAAELDAFQLTTVARAPYVSGGDRKSRLYVLDDALLVFRRTGGTARP